jgi:acyl dehydratase
MTAVGTELPAWELPVTPTLVVSTALATRDFQDVHHDRDLAVQRGSKDIFLNILTTTGLVQRFVGEWARSAVGEGFVIRSCGLRLGAPAYPRDTVRFTGTVTAVEDGTLTIDVVGAVSLGNHVNAQVVVAP